MENKSNSLMGNLFLCHSLLFSILFSQIRRWDDKRHYIARENRSSSKHDEWYVLYSLVHCLPCRCIIFPMREARGWVWIRQDNYLVELALTATCRPQMIKGTLSPGSSIISSEQQDWKKNPARGCNPSKCYYLLEWILPPTPFWRRLNCK